MNDWVKGPTPLTEDTLDVFEGTVCVIMHNGALYDIRGPGRHGGLSRMFGERRLPRFGSLTTLTFERAPTLSRPVTTDVRLRDGATVEVTMQAAIVPLWESKPDALKGVVQRYGVQPARIQETAQLELEESLRVMAVQSLKSLSHGQVHSCTDARTLMQPPSDKGLLTVGHLVTCSISRDQHEETALGTMRDGRLGQLREAVETALARLRATQQNEVDAIRLHGELTGRRETIISEAETNAIAAKLLGIPTVDVAYPGQRQARLEAQYETIRAVLAENMDLLPLLADPTFSTASAGLTNLISGVFPEPGVGQPARRAGPTAAGSPAALAAGAESASGTQIRLLRRAAASGPTGQLEAQLVASRSDRVIGTIGTSGPHRLMIAVGADPVDVGQRALTGVAAWCNVRIGMRVISTPTGETPARLAITRVDSGAGPEHPDVANAIGGWIVAINALLAGMVEISVDR
ncbi:hypothetical protein U2G91_21300 [Rhodococcoides fascians]|uniref:hypothetical protein n=1 Tax=Rhodococcoides fascians TaxID=1828 RepID=UPI002ACDDDA7|nr:hypothetical protein [Rhodococcus fascians]WQH27574.1 hypothetical protein U2G91_21300 [Rhodococcus fascians]